MFIVLSQVLASSTYACDGAHLVGTRTLRHFRICSFDSILNHGLNLVRTHNLIIRILSARRLENI